MSDMDNLEQMLDAALDKAASVSNEDEETIETVSVYEEKSETVTVYEQANAAAASSEDYSDPASAENSRKVRVIGVRFRTAGKVYYFDPGDLPVKKGSYVIVETVRGVEYGKVAGFPMEIDESRLKEPLRGVIRIATEEDTEREIYNREKEKEAYRICQQKIREHGLEMKLIDAEYTFDNSKVLFYFTADGRVDFRNLVKDLAGIFRMRIELRQIGVRDETKILGGYGICGRPLCCHTWLSEFVPVSIKMAKEQNLSLNPGKISGVCGRLMCCLKNEAETYEDLNRNLPRVGDEVQGNDGLTGLVESVNVLRQTVRILVEVDDEKEYHEYEVGDITVLRRRRRGARNRRESGGTTAGKNSRENRDQAAGDASGAGSSEAAGGRSQNAGARTQADSRDQNAGGKSRRDRRRSGSQENERNQDSERKPGRDRRDRDRKRFSKGNLQKQNREERGEQEHE